MAGPIQMQPGGQQLGGWMHQPQVPVGCPPGLEYLTMVDQLLCHQVVELLQAFTGWETNNKYAIKNSMGQQIYYAFEETDLCMRWCCQHQREFTIHIVNNYNQEVLRVYRPFKCCAGCCWCASVDCCAHETFVESPPGNLIGSVRQLASGWTLDFAIRDAGGNTVLTIEGPCLTCACCADVNFPVLTADGKQKVGSVTKQWSGIAKEWFTQADNFGISFPMDLDVKIKGTMIGAMFLIDFMAFEQRNN